jgi:hypothetical protein
MAGQDSQPACPSGAPAFRIAGRNRDEMVGRLEKCDGRGARPKERAKAFSSRVSASRLED